MQLVMFASLSILASYNLPLKVALLNFSPKSKMSKTVTAGAS
ncbi:hypothetical protein THOG11_270027 [Vibrio harveyi]|nr:hypothetical protein TH15OA1_310028 [Vibrio harveyi]CAH1562494.1 hypothetical protein THOD03_290028 [Vibrio harveyi]CAH1568710.1 hypothetical protein THOG11_270027 [Vibrio harveyi]